MKYISTRAADKRQSVGFSDILLGGLAPDGGLYLPDEYPKVSLQNLNDWRTLRYPELAFMVMSPFVDDIPRMHFKEMIDSAYCANVFGTSDITPVKMLREGIYIQGLSEGPTLAFKDLALQFLGLLFDYELKRRGQKMNILGATSGDTGSSAEYAVIGLKRLCIFMLSPKGKMSLFQAAQMYSLRDPNIFNIAVNHPFDYCQALVKQVMNDLEFKREWNIGAVNSINWGRVLAQIVYYFKGYLSLMKDRIGEPVDFIVPSGNFGNICAGHIARMMGLPIRLCLVTNENDVLDEFVQSGVYRTRKETVPTLSPSMDICAASNLERFVADITGRNGKRVSELFTQQGGFKLGRFEWYDIADKFGFTSDKCSNGECLATIRRVWGEDGVMIDPHTATAVNAALRLMEREGKRKIPKIVLETAKPAKFEDAIQRATGLRPSRPSHLEDLERREQFVTEMKDPVADDIKKFIQKFGLK